jgi:hypothetical protein
VKLLTFPGFTAEEVHVHVSQRTRHLEARVSCRPQEWRGQAGSTGALESREKMAAASSHDSLPRDNGEWFELFISRASNARGVPGVPSGFRLLCIKKLRIPSVITNP